MDPIAQVKQAEAKAKQIKEEAKRKAQGDLEFARDYVKRERQQVLSQAQEEKELIYQRARIDGKRQLEKINEETTRVINRLSAVDQSVLEPAVKCIIERILE